ncbi:MAG: C10 family peptidase [Raineya sp.]|jgi:hypothetical protein|nr:C10 family peptidase [Raineya sp.]
MKYILSILGIIVIGYGTLSTSLFFFPDKTKCMQDNAYLTKTQWQQMGGFEKYTPDKLRLGCWSTALAQIAYYHKLKPYGQVQYTSRQGYKVNENMDSSQFYLSKFTNTIDKNTPQIIKDQLAKYNYYAALIVQKDFGTDRYMNKLAPASLFEKNYRVKVNRYIAWHNFGPYRLGKLEQIIYEEINEKRPVFLHFANLKDFGHSVVVDGYCYKDGRFMVHTNQGQGGADDGWYDFYKGIIKPDDNALRVVYTFQPY